MRVRFASLAALPLVLVACAGDDTNPPLPDAGPAMPEAGLDGSVPDAGVDGTVPLLDGATAEAGDASVDAGPPVSVQVVDVTGAAEPGVTLVYSDGSGAFLGSSTTDSTGTGSLVVPAGSQVTVLFGTADAPVLLTTLAVEPGDELLAIDPTSAAANFIEGVSVTALPASPPSGGATFVVNAGTCGASGADAPLTFELYASPPPCVAGGAFPLLVVDQNASGAPLAFAFQKGNSIGSGAGPDGGPLPVSMAAATWASPTQAALLLSNVPPASQTFLAPQFIFTEVSGGVPSTAPNLTASQDDGGVYDVTFSVHPGYADFVQSEANVQHGVPPGTASGAAVLAAIATESATAPSTPLSIDLSQAPPFLETATIDTTTPARPAMSWTSAASLHSTDGVIAIMTWSAGSWTFVVPPDQPGVQAPTIPASLGAWAPTAATTFDPPVVLILEASFWSGYADLRRESASIVTQPLVGVNGCLGTNGGCIPPLPTSGTLSMSAFTSGQ